MVWGSTPDLPNTASLVAVEVQECCALFRRADVIQQVQRWWLPEPLTNRFPVLQKPKVELQARCFLIGNLTRDAMSRVLLMPKSDV